MTITYPSGNDATLTWPPIFDVPSFIIRRTPDWPVGDSRRGGVTQPEVTITDSGLPSGGTYSYTVAPVGMDCSASPTQVTLAPSAPVLSGDGSGTYIATLSWAAVPGATSYTLERDGVTIGTFGAVPPASVVDDDLAPGVAYDYTVIATNDAGSTPSATVSVTVPFTSATDSFSGANGSPLDVTETGNLKWLFPTGSPFTRTGGQAKTTTPIGSNPMAVVNAGTPDIDATIPTTNTGGEALYFRVQDGTNWIRARARMYQTTGSSTSGGYTTKSAWAYIGLQPQESCSPGMVCYYPNDYTEAGNTTMRMNITSIVYMKDMSPGWPLRATCGCGAWYYGQTYTRSVTVYPLVTNYWSDNHYQVVLEKSVNGVISTLATYTTGGNSSLRVVAKGTQISTYANGSMLGAVVESAFQSATQHGVGLGGPTYSTPSGIGDFTLQAAP